MEITKKTKRVIRYHIQIDSPGSYYA